MVKKLIANSILYSLPRNYFKRQKIVVSIVLNKHLVSGRCQEQGRKRDEKLRYLGSWSTLCQPHTSPYVQSVLGKEPKIIIRFKRYLDFCYIQSKLFLPFEKMFYWSKLKYIFVINHNIINSIDGPVKKGLEMKTNLASLQKPYYWVPLALVIDGSA